LQFVNIFPVFKSTLYFCEQLLNLHYFDSLFLPTCCTNSLFYYVYYIHVHVSSTTVIIFSRTIVLTQHLVSSRKEIDDTPEDEHISARSM